MQATPVKKIDPPKTARGLKTRAKILAAAEQVFGNKGFHAASIAEITQVAEVSQGTFYIYFPDKEEAFRALVEYMGQETQAFIRQRTGAAQSRIEAERLGLQAFLSFVAEHKNLYRIVLESLFVDEAIYRNYFSNFGALYQGRLAAAADNGEISAGDTEVRAWCLMGISHFLGMRYGLWDNPQAHARVVDAATDFISNGLRAGGAT
ncbi:AcrR family transcriptional regulator [Janthinobacterium sp. CG_23.3]|uniref:TetR/AcrR family transcriptional regulator n=1 Tax=unclassified Janthinobacterium TaxID=2610881 RepID=UPI000346A78C|nr:MULTISPECIES: TetR/AcrR family transcriptional regulator [unclassified Janthinobacterium]MEC5163324.1 AcrR family transcriptional regulator [Janthinobacterium sp. CG_S6]